MKCRNQKEKNEDIKSSQRKKTHYHKRKCTQATAREPRGKEKGTVTAGPTWSEPAARVFLS